MGNSRNISHCELVNAVVFISATASLRKIRWGIDIALGYYARAVPDTSVGIWKKGQHPVFAPRWRLAYLKCGGGLAVHWVNTRVRYPTHRGPTC